MALVRGRPDGVRRRFEQACADGARLTTSSVAIVELWRHVSRSERGQASARRLRAFLGGPIEVLAFDLEDALAAADTRVALERLGTPIGHHDVLIAGQALRRRSTLVTANTGEFSRVSGLRWEDWATAA